MANYSITDLYNKISELSTQKESLRQTLLAQGADVSTNVLLDDYPTVINGMCPHPDIRLEYLENGPASGSTRKAVYFDTGFVPDTSTKVDMKYYISQTSSEQVVFGCNGSGYYFFESPGSSTVGYKFTGGNAALSVNTVATAGTHVVTTYRYNLAPKMIVDGTTYTGVDTALNTISYPIYLFARNASGSAANQCLGATRIYSFDIWQYRTLMRSYIPVLHWNGSQYVACFYDRVNNNYIYNLGTDTLTYKIR